LDETILATGFAGITDLKAGPDGRLYVVSFGDGKIYAISNAASPSLSFGITLLPPSEVGVPYIVDLDISGGTPPYSASLDAGTLPAGLNLVDGVISGTPASSKRSRFILRVTDDAGASLTKRFNISVLGAVSISNKSLPSGRAGRRYKARLKAKAGQKPYAWSLIAGSLPSGLTFDVTSASISGTPLAVGETSLGFQVTDPLGGVAQKTLTLSIR
jgi:hypothetical protein